LVGNRTFCDHDTTAEIFQFAGWNRGNGSLLIGAWSKARLLACHGRCDVHQRLHESDTWQCMKKGYFLSTEGSFTGAQFGLPEISTVSEEL